MRLNTKEIAKAVKGKISGKTDTIINNVIIDSRKVLPPCLFVAIKGERLDGHAFIKEAINLGAKAVICEHIEEEIDGISYITVGDTTKALQDLAKYYLKKMDVKVVAVTGSCGKTSTKEMITSVLESKYKVCKTKGNLNNHIGLPLTIFTLEEDDDIIVLEMGMSNPGEIECLAKIAEPDIAVITNIGVSHIENLGSQENILKAKLEITKASETGELILNADDELLDSASSKWNITKYSAKKNADVTASEIYTNFRGNDYLLNNEQEVSINTPGIHNVENSLAAAAVGIKFGISLGDIARGISNYVPYRMRNDITEYKGMTIINDAYNASPDSVKAAIDIIMLRDSRRIVVLGDMLELGKYSEDLHREIGAVLAKNEIDFLLCTGKNTKHTVDEYNKTSENKAEFFDNKEDLYNKLKEVIKENDTILIKGSRGMQMEEIAEWLKTER